jgi:predicted nucleic acid-binding protein
MNKQPAFWDSSALVPLCVHESASRRAHSQLRKFLPVVWWGSLVEVHSAIARLHRRGKLNAGEKQKALSQLDVLDRNWREVLPGDHVRDLAAHLLDAHDLRAADSLQLAAALTWCQERPAGRNFLCSNERLSKAAIAVGFSVLRLS